MDDILDSIGKSIIDRASERVLHRFEFSTNEDHGIGIPCAIDLKSAFDAYGEIRSPCSLIIKAETKKKPNEAMRFLIKITRALSDSGLIKTERFREIYFSRVSSFEEKVEFFLVALDD